MNNLYDFGQAIIKIRDAIDVIEVKGARNAGLVTLIFNKCNEIINELNKIVQEKSDESKVENHDQVGEDDGENDS